MAINTILTPVDGRPSDTALLEAALVLASQFRAHIKVLHIVIEAVEREMFPRNYGS